MILRRGVSLSTLIEILGEPVLRDGHAGELYRVSAVMWSCAREGNPQACAASKFIPLDGEEFPNGNWMIQPCPAHAGFFTEYPIVEIGDPVDVDYG
jgi:hypothetical protein